MLNIHFANRYESLSRLLVQLTGAAGGSPFDQDHIIIPSAAVKRRLTLDIASQRGICTNVRFSYLAQWLWQQTGRVLAGAPEQSPYDAPVLAWRVFAAFNDSDWNHPHTRLGAYLEHADPVMRFELAQRVAGNFEQYMTYRPDWIDTWARGGVVDLGQAAPASAQADQAWQAALWRRLASEIGNDGRHPAAAFEQALLAMGDAADLAHLLPASAHIFALPTMPPMHLRLLQLLGRRIDLHLYVQNPCREFWFEVVKHKRLATLAAQGKATYHEEGHRLLAAWGQQTQSHLGLLVDADDAAAIDDAHFTESGSHDLLACLQDSILNLADLAPGSVRVDAHERSSVEVHVCHSLTREIEVLQDRLLALFAGPDAPLPGDVLVVTPDLDSAAPLIDAIFGTVARDRTIPYTITGRARSDVNAPAHALLDLLSLATSRCTVSAVFGLLQQPVVARRFGLDTDALNQVRAWLQQAGVHWALDAEHRASLGLPAMVRHSFADGMDRLFLGYALPTQVDAPFDGRLPAGDAQGSDALALGALGAFLDALAALRRSVSAPRPAAQWPGLLAEALATFVAPTDRELEDMGEVQAVLDQWGTLVQRSAVTLPLPIDVVRAALTGALDDPVRGGVPTGMVTFTSMSSLRTIPFKVVCAIGLNDGAFPTSTRAEEFDLLQHQPRRGDRQRRTDERNLFLDLLLAARERVHLSYVGRSLRDNAVMPPSVLVSELLEYLTPVIAGADADAATLARARRHLVVEHPLQPFSEIAFRTDSDLRLRSFHREYAEALQNSRMASARAGDAALPAPVTAATAAANDVNGVEDTDDSEELGAPFFANPLPEPGPEWRDVPLERLLQFYRHPCRYLLERRLHIALRRSEEELQDDEPFLADIPARSALARRLLPPLLAGADVDTLRTLALAGTDVPMGALGRQFLEHELQGLQGFAESVTRLTHETCLAPHRVAVDLNVDGQMWRVHAGFADLRTNGLVGHRYDDRRPGDYVAAWLRHLMLCVDPPSGVTPVSTWQGRDGQFRFRPCSEPLPVLETLVRLYARGLREPLYFFPKSAWSYMEKGGSDSAAAQAWRVSKQRPHAEASDAVYRLALRGLPDPVGDGFPDFAECAHAVLDPLRTHLEPT